MFFRNVGKTTYIHAVKKPKRPIVNKKPQWKKNKINMSLAVFPEVFKLAEMWVSFQRIIYDYVPQDVFLHYYPCEKYIQHWMNFNKYP